MDEADLRLQDLLSGIDFDLSVPDVVMSPAPTTSSSESPRPEAILPGTQRTQRHRKKHQDELAFLKRKVHELSEHLRVLQQVKELEAGNTPQSEWKTLAQLARQRQHDVMTENRRLKAAIEEQVKFAEYLVTILEKKPRLGLLSADANDQWQLLKLVADPTARALAFHAIVDREYAKLDTVMIEGGLIDLHEETHSYVPKLVNGALEVQVSVFILYGVHFNLLAEASWQVLRGSVELETTTGTHVSYQQLHQVDPSTVYISSMWYHSNGGYQGRMIVKRYIEANRQVIISRSIHEDELHPLVDGCAIANEVSWVAFDCDPTTGLARARYFQRMKPTYFADEQNDRSHLALCQFLMELCEQSSMTFEHTIKTQLYRLLSKPLPPKKRP
ncbi:hypothetical protein SDRG_06525 [Saprolegnia diclina VS20]|uniref:START domain-containing protein n=1 Tax=Saprolegnia diclina (strain VS20) TaxID=1156394 RepID=T0QM22_SAPDV|nr:hypothetical protein SDRG_06525 [Saprolegnia diclina VS20]EQC35766.1 hypothetical protein SDRG_06525 [Saprolegnia diclina VS20]|eukprot:XP_008610528.1 hypothetical protein SDRG_06525 [Saprolegnia diclina VS20]